VIRYANFTIYLRTFIFLFLLQSFDVVAQRFAESGFTRKDSLRGHLNSNRSCFDVKYYDLSIRIDPETKSIFGYNRILLESTRDFQKIQLDLFSNMVIDSVVHNGTNLIVEREYDAFIIQFPDIVTKGQQIFLTIHYHGKPITAQFPPWDGGFVWEKDSLYRDWIGVSCQGIGASLWWPNKDHLSDRPDSMQISIEIPGSFTGVSNGKFIDTLSLNNGNKKWIWKVSYPINNYNVSINIGHYSYFKEKYNGEGGSVDLNFFVLDYNLEKAKKQFMQVQPMLRCYEYYFGPYPFINDGFKLVETPYYGMEHQSGIAYGNEYQNNEFDFDYIIIHESGHEYWGNSVSIGDLGEIWVHESFTTYMESLYMEYFHGREAAIEYLELQKETISNKFPMLGPLEVNYDNWMDTDIYFKGAWLLHSIRNTINDDSIWFKLLKETYQEFKYQIITSKDIIQFINANYEYDLEPVFNNFLNNEKIPVLKVTEKKKKDKRQLKYRWKDVNDDFNMPVEIYYNGDRHRLYPTLKKKKYFIERDLGENIQYATDRFYFRVKRR
jgi:aminopeptidase N